MGCAHRFLTFDMNDLRQIVRAVRNGNIAQERIRIQFEIGVWMRDIATLDDLKSIQQYRKRLDDAKPPSDKTS